MTFCNRIEKRRSKKPFLEDHDRIKRELGGLTERVDEFGLRLQRVELELGIYKPPISGDDDSS